MHIQTTVNIGKDGTKTRVHLLRESYREHGKVKKRTLANLSHLPEPVIKSLKEMLAGGHAGQPVGAESVFRLVQGAPVGATMTAWQIAGRLSIPAALGHDKEGKLALWQVIARVVEQGSRLSAVRLARHCGAASLLGLGKFDEDDLYANLDWLCANQEVVEDAIFAARHPGGSDLYLYDITSSYLEGTDNALAAFGYNRDRKRGKMQIVVGLLCDGEGFPVSVQVFPGNTNDHKTVAGQIGKISSRFGGGRITFVGDRGMLKSQQVRDLIDKKMYYITAITKPQIETLLDSGVFQMSLFDVKLAEVEDGDVRYVLKKNPVRAAEIQRGREDKLAALGRKAKERNDYLETHPKATVAAALKQANAQAAKLKISGWAEVKADGRKLSVTTDQAKLAEAAELDGCYALKTNLPAEVGAAVVHGRYKDLAMVETAFRSCKTVNLELRPVNVRKESRTRGHVFVVMLAYMVTRELSRLWAGLDLTVEEGIARLGEICLMKHYLDDRLAYTGVPEQEGIRAELLRAAGVTLPDRMELKENDVDTKEKLTKRRK